VDNLVQGLLLCAETEGVNGAAYIMGDGVSLTWADFYRYFTRITGAEPCGTVTRAQCEAATAAARRSPSASALLRATLLNSEARLLYPKYPLYRLVRGRVPQILVDRAKRRRAGTPSRASRGPNGPPPPSMNEYRDYARRGAFSIALAERELGYRPPVSLPVAIDRTAAWLHFAEFLPEVPQPVAADRQQ
jgi:nucleoside-diphosphate-sugar epimerase